MLKVSPSENILIVGKYSCQILGENIKIYLSKHVKYLGTCQIFGANIKIYLSRNEYAFALPQKIL